METPRDYSAIFDKKSPNKTDIFLGFISLFFVDFIFKSSAFFKFESY